MKRVAAAAALALPLSGCSTVARAAEIIASPILFGLVWYLFWSGRFNWWRLEGS